MMAHPSWLGVRQINSSQMESAASMSCVITTQKVDMTKNVKNVQTFNTMANAVVLGSLRTRVVNNLIGGKWIKSNPGQSHFWSALLPCVSGKDYVITSCSAIFPVAIPRLASGNIFPITVLVPRIWFRPLCTHLQCPEKLFQCRHIL